MNVLALVPESSFVSPWISGCIVLIGIAEVALGCYWVKSLIEERRSGINKKMENPKKYPSMSTIGFR